MKRKILLFLGGIVLFAFILVTSFAWSKIFYGGDEISSEIPVLHMKLTEENSQVDTTQDYPTKSPGSAVTPYTFTVSNSSSKDGEYQLLLEEEAVSNQVGHRQQDLLTRKQLKYQLTLNSVVIEEGKLDSLKNNVLDHRIIHGKGKNNYALKIWVHDDVKTGEWENKYYYYKVTLKTLGE